VKKKPKMRRKRPAEEGTSGLGGGDRPARNGAPRPKRADRNDDQVGEELDSPIGSSKEWPFLQ